MVISATAFRIDAGIFSVFTQRRKGGRPQKINDPVIHLPARVLLVVHLAQNQFLKFRPVKNYHGHLNFYFLQL